MATGREVPRRLMESGILLCGMAEAAWWEGGDGVKSSSISSSESSWSISKSCSSSSKLNIFGEDDRSLGFISVEPGLGADCHFVTVSVFVVGLGGVVCCTVVASVGATGTTASGRDSLGGLVVGVELCVDPNVEPRAGA